MRPWVWLKFVPSEGGVEVREPRGRFWQGCVRSVGLYAIERESADTMRFAMVTDDRSGRSASYDGATFTRHTVLVGIMGTWVAQAKDHTRLFVREDMRFCLL